MPAVAMIFFNIDLKDYYIILTEPEGNAFLTSFLNLYFLISWVRAKKPNTLIIPPPLQKGKNSPKQLKFGSPSTF